MSAGSSPADIGDMAATPEEHLDIVSDLDGEWENAKQPARASEPTGRPWIGVLFECCDVYRRVYRKHEQSRYVGHCPKCGRRVSLRVGPDGVKARLFRASPL